MLKLAALVEAGACKLVLNTFDGAMYIENTRATFEAKSHIVPGSALYDNMVQCYTPNCYLTNNKPLLNSIIELN